MKDDDLHSAHIPGNLPAGEVPQTFAIPAAPDAPVALLPCPFCGHFPSLVERGILTIRGRTDSAEKTVCAYSQVACGNLACYVRPSVSGVSGHHQTVEVAQKEASDSAIMQWNARPSQGVVAEVMRDMYLHGYGDGQNKPNGYESEKDIQKAILEVATEHKLDGSRDAKGKELLNQVALHFDRYNEQRFEPLTDTFKSPMTGRTQENAMSIPVRILRAISQWSKEGLK